MPGIAPTPDGPTAAQWAADELARWHTQLPDIIGWLRRLVQRFSDMLNGTQGTPIVIPLLVAIAVLIAVIVAIVTFRNRLTARAKSSRVFDEAAQTEPLEAQLQRALDAQNWDDAYVARFRILARDAGNIGLVRLSPALTASEVAARLDALPLSQPVAPWARAFSDTRFGNQPRSRADYEQLTALHSQLPKRASAAGGVHG